MDKDILDINQASLLLGVSVALVYKLARSGKIPAAKIGRVWRFHRPTLVDWVANGASLNSLQFLLKKSSVSKAWKHN